MFLFCLVFAMFCARLFICASWSPAGKGLTSWFWFVVSSVSLSLSHWYPGSGVVLDCIDSWSLQPYLLFLHVHIHVPECTGLQVSVYTWCPLAGARLCVYMQETLYRLHVSEFASNCVPWVFNCRCHGVFERAGDCTCISWMSTWMCLTWR